jgi:hypothetical protein
VGGHYHTAQALTGRHAVCPSRHAGTQHTQQQQRLMLMLSNACLGMLCPSTPLPRSLHGACMQLHHYSLLISDLVKVADAMML